MPIRWIALLAVLAAPPAAAGDVPLTTLSDRERRTLDRYLEAPDWPIRVFGLLRLDRYTGDEVNQILRRDAAEGAWPLRCFALRQAHRQGLRLKEADVGPLDEPHVLRAALCWGVEIDEELVRRTARRLLRTKTIDALMLGMEIAAASDLQKLRADAARRAGVLIRNMDPTVQALVGRRLAVVLGVAPVPLDVRRWRGWLRAQREPLPLAPRRPPPAVGAAGTPSLVAEMDQETFNRLWDYLDVLRQRDLDMALVMDSTYSMLPMIDEARAGVDSLILFFNDMSRTMRLAFVAYRDHDNKPVWEGHPFTADVNSIRKFLFAIRITGGADLPEAVFEGLAACGSLQWNPQATRTIILIGDARPHEADTYRVLEVVQSYVANRINLHAVHVPMKIAPADEPFLTPQRRQEIDEHNRRTVAVFAEIAEAGGGRLITLADAQELVTSLMHVAIEETWWPVFDEFYGLYLELCR